jgi:hypothetical protein
VGEVRGLLPHGDEIMVFGNLILAGEVPTGGVAAWAGDRWRRTGMEQQHDVACVALWRDDIIAGSGRTVNAWNGTTWRKLGEFDGAVTELEVVGDDLFAGGVFRAAGEVPAFHVARLADTAWVSLRGGLNDAVGALAAYQGRLVAAGRFTESVDGPLPYVAVWNGERWEGLGDGLPAASHALHARGDTLYAAGWTQSAEGRTVPYVWRWDGSTWAPMEPPPLSGIECLTTIDGRLHAGGRGFPRERQPGVRPLGPPVAWWNGAAWELTASDVSGNVRGLAGFRGDLILVGEGFVTDGGRVWSHGIVRARPGEDAR